MPLVDAEKLRLANHFYAWGWRGSIIGAVVTALSFIGTKQWLDGVGPFGAFVTLVSLTFLFAGTKLRERNAEEQLERIRKRARNRYLDAAIFKAALEGRPKAMVEIRYAGDDGDSFKLADQLYHLLGEVGWDRSAPVPFGPDSMYPLDVPLTVPIGNGKSRVVVVPLDFRTMNMDRGRLKGVWIVSSIPSNVAGFDPEGPPAKTADKALGGAIHACLDASGQAADPSLPRDVIRVVIAPKA